jgi:hypothetical protein
MRYESDHEASVLLYEARLTLDLFHNRSVDETTPSETYSHILKPRKNTIFCSSSMKFEVNYSVYNL